MRLPFRLDDSRLVRALPFVLGVAAFAIAARNLIGSYDDLGIYLDIARELWHGTEDLYRLRPHGTAWAYPPCAALPFAALLAIAGDAGARWLWCLGLGVATALLAIDLRTAMRAVGGLSPWRWLAFGALFQRFVAQNLTHGQLSLWVGVCVLRGVVRLQQGRDVRAGLWLGAAAALKLTPVAFVLALPFMGRPRAALAQLAAVLAAVLLLPWPLLGTARHCVLLQQFDRAVLAPVAGAGTFTVVTDHHAGPSVSGTLDYLLQPLAADDRGHTVNVLDLDTHTLSVVKAAWLAAILAVLIAWGLRAWRLPPARRLAEQSAAVMLAIAFTSPLTRVYHLAGALLPGALFCRGPRGRRDVLWWAAAAALLLSMTLRQRNLLGETLWRALDLGGLLHFALVAVAVWLCAACRSTPAAAEEAT